MNIHCVHSTSLKGECPLMFHDCGEHSTSCLYTRVPITKENMTNSLIELTGQTGFQNCLKFGVLKSDSPGDYYYGGRITQNSFGEWIPLNNGSQYYFCRFEEAKHHAQITQAHAIVD